MLSMLMYFVNLDFGIHHFQKGVEVTYKKKLFLLLEFYFIESGF